MIKNNTFTISFSELKFVLFKPHKSDLNYTQPNNIDILSLFYFLDEYIEFELWPNTTCYDPIMGRCKLFKIVFEEA